MDDKTQPSKIGSDDIGELLAEYKGFSGEVLRDLVASHLSDLHSLSKEFAGAHDPKAVGNFYIEMKTNQLALLFAAGEKKGLHVNNFVFPSEELAHQVRNKITPVIRYHRFEAD